MELWQRESGTKSCITETVKAGQLCYKVPFALATAIIKAPALGNSTCI